MPLTCASLGDWLREKQFISAAQADEVRALTPRFANLGGLLKELVKRGWLTPYQMVRLNAGDGDDLVVGPYRVLEVLGEGAMGRVLKARHSRTNRLVALKILHKDKLTNPKTVERFSREITATSQLTHPNIVKAVDVDLTGGNCYLAMELVDGVDLSRLVKQGGPLPVAQACEFIRQAALGLQHAYEHDVVHRDIKPGNLLVTWTSGRMPQIKMLDFGLARFESESDRANRLTQAGNLVGTVDYMAPEQAQDARKADIRADIYSLGCSLYYLLTAQPPFAGDSAVEKLSARMMGEPPRVRQVRGEVPAALEAVILKMMARDPGQRHQTPSEAAAALVPFARGQAPPAQAPAPQPVPTAALVNDVPVRNASAVKPEPPKSGGTWDLTPSSADGQARPSRPFTLDRRVWWIAGGAVGLVLIVALLVIIFQGRDPETPPVKPPGPAPDRPGPVVRDPPKKKADPPKKVDPSPAGYYARSINGNPRLPLELLPNKDVRENGRKIGAWVKIDEQLQVLLDANRGTVTFKTSTAAPLLGWHNTDDETWSLRRIDDEPVPLFNGIDLQGWKTPDSNWAVRDGILSAKGKGPLLSERTDFENFELRLETRVRRGSIGHFLRAGMTAPGKLTGYGLQIAPSGKLGLFYKPGALMTGNPNLTTEDPAIPPDTWVTQHIVVDGNVLQVKYTYEADGKNHLVHVLKHFVDEGRAHARGGIAFMGFPQSDDFHIEIRSIEITERRPWIQLFAGQGMWNWKKDAAWRVENRVLIGESANRSMRLVTQRDTWMNFHLLVEGRLVPPGDDAEAAITFRALPGKGAAYRLAVPGVLSKMLGSKKEGLVESLLAGPLEKPFTDAQGWFSVEIRAEGSHLQVLSRGRTLANVQDASLIRGAIILSASTTGSNPVRMEFRRVEVRELR